MAMDNALFPNENATEDGFSEDRMEMQNAQGRDPISKPTDQTWPMGKSPDGQTEHFEDPDDPCRSALMDCYNR
jgi:hypothetical protein